MCHPSEVTRRSLTIHVISLRALGKESGQIGGADAVAKKCTLDYDAEGTASQGRWKYTTVTSCSGDSPSPRGGCSWTKVGTASYRLLLSFLHEHHPNPARPERVYRPLACVKRPVRQVFVS